MLTDLLLAASDEFSVVADLLLFFLLSKYLHLLAADADNDTDSNTVSSTMNSSQTYTGFPPMYPNRLDNLVMPS